MGISGLLLAIILSHFAALERLILKESKTALRATIPPRSLPPRTVRFPSELDQENDPFIAVNLDQEATKSVSPISQTH